MRNLRLLVACTAIFAMVFAVSCGDDDAGETNCTDGLDNDGDGPIDCLDSDCASNQACQTVCNNNNLCEPALGENETNCPADCSTASYCGDNTCDADEDATSCPADCSSGQCVSDADVLADLGCGAGETCDLAQTGTECRLTGAVANYADCTAPTDCGANASCLSVDGGATAQCLPYCDIQTTTPPAACPGAGVCAASITDHASLGLCLEQSDLCDPVLNTGCTAPDMCFLFAAGADCAAPTGTPGAVGAACDGGSPSGCVEGSSCFNTPDPICFEVCLLADGSGCDSGTCQDLIASPTYGVCQ